MAKISRDAGSTSQILEIFIRDSSSTTGGGLTGLVFNSAGLTAYYHRNTDTTATAITLVTMTVGTFTSSGFKEIDATNMPGWYQFCPPNAAFASGSSVSIHLKGATNMAPCPIEIDLKPDANIARVLGTAVTATTGGILDVNAKNIGNTAQTGRDIGASVLLSPGTGAGQISLASGSVTVGTNSDKTGYSLSVTPPTSAQIATAVWQDTTAGDFTVANSIGKSLYTSGNAPGAASGLALVGSSMVAGTVSDKTGYSLSVTPPTAAQVATAVWQDTTAGDFTVSSSIGKSLYTSGNVPGAASGLAIVGSNMGTVSSVTGAVGSVTGSVGSVTAAVTVGTNNDKTGYTLSTAGVDAVWAKTFTALTSVPAITSDVLNGINWVFTLARDKVTQTATSQVVYKDDGTTTLGTATVSDDGTVFTRGKFA